MTTPEKQDKRTRLAQGAAMFGAVVDGRELVAISGDRIRVPDPDRVVHLQFRHFAA